jgi:hypothetical protein
MQEGTINVSNSGLQFTTSTGSSFLLNPGALGEAIIQALQPSLPPLGVILPGTSWTLAAGNFTFKGSAGNSGTVTLLPNTVFSVLGDPDTNEGYVQWGQDSATYLQGTSTLVSPFEPVQIDNGTLATVWAGSVSSGTATIISPLVKVIGGNIYINYGLGLTSHSHFGELVVDGNVKWTGGTFHAYVYADGTTSDVWRTTNDNGFGGVFDIDAGTVDAIYVDSDYGLSSFPNSGDDWEIIQAGGGLADTDAPTVSNTTLWNLAIEPGPASPRIYWKVVAN